MAGQKFALVVGASRGIGLGVVQEFLGRGWNVIATARDPAQATALRDLVEIHPGQLAVAGLEMTDPAAVDGFTSQLGDTTLDVALINAGVSGPEHRNASQATEKEIGALLYTNAVAPVRLARTLASHIRPRTGILAFTSSIMGSIALNGGGHELYRASKAALNSLTRGLAVELRGKNLTVLSLHPGWVATDMGGAGAPVSVDESAAGLVSVIEKQAGKQGHRFLDYTGKELAW
jgi:NAD(P)-dependent dehydrogenase (short-subunit alcohol dehydrogenase family)